MSLTRFCCCCDLRRGCIVFTWLQLMFIAMAIAGMAIPLYILSYTAQPYSYSYNDDDGQIRYSYRGPNPGDAIGIYSGISMLIAQQTIKGITCIALIWGLVKKQHLFYQAWMFISGIENCLLSISFICCFFGGFALPILFAPMLGLAPFVGLSWYFWFSVYAVYQSDMKLTNVAFSENYERISLIMNNTTPHTEEA